MRRGGVISGRILDSNGEPAVGMKVVARVESRDGTLSFEAEADDLGEYRVSGLPAGRYTVAPLISGPRIVTVTENERVIAMAKQGRRLQDVLQESNSPPRSAEVQSGDETGNIDFEVTASHTLRAVAPVAHRLPQVQPMPDGRPGAALGPAVPELGGASLFNISIDGSAPRSLDIMFSGGGAISGTLVDAAGEPFQGVVVRALRVRREHGGMVARTFGWERVTDDRGRYRLFGLMPGSYLIVASLDATEFTSGGSSSIGLTTLYFPGMPRIDAAQPLQVDVGSELTGTDLIFSASPVVRITGKAVDGMGQPLVGRVMLRVSQRSWPITTDPRTVRTGPDGSFELVDVAPGDYVIQATADVGFGGPPEFGSEYVTVTDGDPAPLMISTSRGVTLEGRFVVEGMDNPPMRAYSLQAVPVDLDRSPSGRGPSSVAIHDNGRFYLTGLFGRMRLTAPNTLPGWYLKSVIIGGVDVTDTPYDFGLVETTVGEAEIVLSNSGAAIAGSIEGRPRSRTTPSTVVAFSTNRDNWFDGSRHVKRISSGPTGSFEVNGLPPGDYFVAAVDTAAPLDVQAPEALESLVLRAARVTAREGAVSEVTLSLIRR